MTEYAVTFMRGTDAAGMRIELESDITPQSLLDYFASKVC